MINVRETRRYRSAMLTPPQRKCTYPVRKCVVIQSVRTLSESAWSYEVYVPCQNVRGNTKCTYPVRKCVVIRIVRTLSESAWSYEVYVPCQKVRGHTKCTYPVRKCVVIRSVRTLSERAWSYTCVFVVLILPLYLGISQFLELLLRCAMFCFVFILFCYKNVN
jgi:hypothetical protein